MIKKTFNAIKTSARQAPQAALYSFGGMMGGDWDWGDMMGFGFGGGILGGLMMILFWVIVIMAGLAFLRWLTHDLASNTGSSKTAMDILKEKYAKGEITKEEFETKKKDIM